MSETKKVNTAPIKWAQRSDSLYITIALPDVKDETIQLKDKTLSFTGKSNDKEYALEIEFFQDVDASHEDTKYKVLPRSVQMHVMKTAKKDDASDDTEFWPRLLKNKALEKNQVKIDWDRYVDEDEEEEDPGFDMSALQGGMGMGGMPGMPGMGGGMGGMPGMGGGMGGMPGMGGGMGGMPGMGGAGGMDMEALMKQMGQMGGAGGLGGMGGLGGGDDEEDSDDEDDDGDLPDLEEA